MENYALKSPRTDGFEQVKFLDMKWKTTHYKMPETDGFEQGKFTDIKWKTMLLKIPGN
jgi:hypothetical protein